MIEAQGHHGRFSFKKREGWSLGITNRWASKAGGGALQRPGAERGQAETQRLQGKGQRELRGVGEKRRSHVAHLTGPESKWQGMPWTLSKWAVCRVNRDF